MHLLALIAARVYAMLHSYACVNVPWSVRAAVSPAKTVEPIEMPFGDRLPFAYCKRAGV